MASSAPSRVKTTLISTIKWGAGVAIVGIVLLAIWVAVKMAQLPDYAQLTQRSDLGQKVNVRAADGTLLVAIGPNLGRWLPYKDIPATMRTAMIAVEDRRFRSHVGVDPIGVAR